MGAPQRAAARGLRSVLLAAAARTVTTSTLCTTTTSPAPLITPLFHNNNNNDRARGNRAAAAAAAAAASPLPDDEGPEAPPTSSSVLVPRRSVALTGSDVGLYYPIDPPRLLPEALRPLHQAGYAPRPSALSRRAGCRSLQQELEATSDASALGGSGGARQGGKKQDGASAATSGKVATTAAATTAAGSAASTTPTTTTTARDRPPSLMYRRCVHDLVQALQSGQGPARVLLEGPAGCGKSLALAALVEWARQQQPGAGGASGEAGAATATTSAAAANGWVALYVPSAAALTSGGFFERRPDDGTYDTLLSAQAVLRGAAEAHGDVLARMPRRCVGGGAGGASSAAAPYEEALRTAEEAAGVPRGEKATLMDLVDAGLRADVDEARRAVECVLSLVRELGRAATLAAEQAAASPSSSSTPPLPRVLIAIDDYNALHWTTGYGRTVFVEGKGGGGTATGAAPAGTRRYSYREVLSVEELNLARGLRLMAGGGGLAGGGDAPLMPSSATTALLTPLLLGPHARVVCATTASSGAGSAATAASFAEAERSGGTTYSVPRFSEAEVTHALHHYYERGMIGCPPSEREARKMAALTSGNGAELRRLAVEVTAVDSADGFA